MDIHPFKRDHAGFSMIEVMVALLVLSIGLLGIAGLFISTLQDTRGSLYRSKAVALAWDMAERIRVNGEAGEHYAAGLEAEADCAESKDTVTVSSCTPEQLAKHDLYEWNELIESPQNGVPSGTGTIKRDANTVPPTYTIEVQWKNGVGADGTEDTDLVEVVTQL